MEKKYSLGASKVEQERLEKQRILYGDSKYLEEMLQDTYSVCEVGCGAGANLWVAKKLQKGKFVGIDIQAEQIEASKRKAQLLNLTNTEFYCSDGNGLPLKDNSFDFTFCRLLLIHLTNPMDILAEMYRITKPNGIIVVIDAEVNSYLTNKSKLLECFKARCNYVYSATKGSINIVNELPQMFEQLKLTNINIIKHKVKATGKEKEIVLQLYKNWLGMIDSVIETLIKDQLVSMEDYKKAQEEVQNITDEDYILQFLTIISGRK